MTKKEKNMMKDHGARIMVRYDVGMNNALYIRGQGPGLNWEKGMVMKNAGPDVWIWETDSNCNNCEFKVLINDKVYEEGANHRLATGKTLQYSPRFPK
jgi:hypothetical protein